MPQACGSPLEGEASPIGTGLYGSTQPDGEGGGKGGGWEGPYRPRSANFKAPLAIAYYHLLPGTLPQLPEGDRWEGEAATKAREEPQPVQTRTKRTKGDGGEGERKSSRVMRTRPPLAFQAMARAAFPLMRGLGNPTPGTEEGEGVGRDHYGPRSASYVHPGTESRAVPQLPEKERGEGTTDRHDYEAWTRKTTTNDNEPPKGGAALHQVADSTRMRVAIRSLASSDPHRVQAVPHGAQAAPLIRGGEAF